MILKWRVIKLEENKKTKKKNVMKDYLIGYSGTEDEKEHIQKLQFIINEWLKDEDVIRIIIDKDKHNW